MNLKHMAGCGYEQPMHFYNNGSALAYKMQGFGEVEEYGFSKLIVYLELYCSLRGVVEG